jgi:flagellar protein FliO/FliZ
MRKHLYLICLFCFASLSLFAQTNVEPQPQTTPLLPEQFQVDLQKETKKEDEDRFVRDFTYMMFLLGVLIATLLILTWITRRLLNTRMQQVNLTSMIKILERRPLSPKSTVYLLDVQGNGFVVAESHSGLFKLGNVALPSEEVEPEEERV